MLKTGWFAFGFAVAILAGCAGIESDVRASLPDASALDAGPRTYAFAHSAVAPAGEDVTRYELAIADALAKHDFDAVPDARARLRVSVAYDTHAEPVSVLDETCKAQDECRAWQPSLLLRWLGRERFVHSLTLRFFDRATGREIYKVSASSRDREAESRASVAYLVQSAFAHMPYDGSSRWHVRLRRAQDGNAISVVSVKPDSR